jgi:DNA primase
MSERPYVSFAEVKQQITIPDTLELFGIADRFRKEGKTLTGVCPLKSHTHSLSPNPNQFKIAVRDGVSVFHCFGDCQRGGDVIEFVKLMTGLDDSHVRFWFWSNFQTRLTQQRGRRQRTSTPAANQERKKAGETVQESQPAESQISESNVSDDGGVYKPIRFRLQVDPSAAYLRERGLTEKTIERYGLGVAKRGMLAGYVAIPVWDYPKGEYPYGYLGRWAGEDYDDAARRPRYKWPPNFPKQRFLFGLQEALDGTDGQPVIVVEGVFAALHCIQNGFPCTVAAFGSSLSAEQVKLLVQTDRPIVLMFDGGEPGWRGMSKAAHKLTPRAFVRIIRLKTGIQPDQLSSAELTSRM